MILECRNISQGFSSDVLCNYKQIFYKEREEDKYGFLTTPTVFADYKHYIKDERDNSKIGYPKQLKGEYDYEQYKNYFNRKEKTK